MTILIYPGQMPSRPIEEHPWAGTVGEWFAAAGIDYAAHDEQPVSVAVNGVAVPAAAWADTVVSNADVVEIRPVPRADPITWLYVAVAALAVVAYVSMPKIPKNKGSQQGQNLNSADASANVAKPNAVVPELLGRFRRYPDYLVQPRRYFADPRTQYLEMLLCIGPGTYDLESVRVGDTDLSALDGFEHRIYTPGASLAAEPAALNWYNVSEVGGTSAGTAGLDLTAVADGAAVPTGGTLSLSGSMLTTTGTFPQAWGVGTAFALIYNQAVTVTLQSVGSGEDRSHICEFAGQYQDIPVGAALTAQGDLSGSFRVKSNTGTLMRLQRYVRDGEGGGSYVDFNSLAPGAYSIGFAVAGRVYEISAITDSSVTVFARAVTGWPGFPALTVPMSGASFSALSDTVYGELAGPFAVCPASEVTTTIEVDFLLPQGLCYVNDDGDLEQRTVGVEVGWRQIGASSWSGQTFWYTQATLDQIGFTERITVPSGRYEVRIRRRGARSTSTQVQDVVQWYGLRCLLPGPSSYPWTTLAVKIKGLGQIAASSENQINVVATRKLHTLQPNGTWSALATPTRDISAAAGYIAQSIGYTDANLDMPEWQRLHGIWNARSETFDFVFDETTVREALTDVLRAGMAEMTLEDGRIKPVREGIRTVFEHGYSAQNTLDGIKRAFRAPRPDDNDGVEVEYVDAVDSWATKTVVCKLPGSLGVKLEKVKLEGVTDRTRAWRIGMRRACQQKYSRWTYTFATEMDALNSSYGSYVPLVIDVPGFGQSAILTRITGNASAAVLTVNEPLQWTPDQPHVLALRRPDGSTAGPWPAAPGADAYTVHVAGITAADWPEVTLQHEPPHVYFGPATRWTHAALITEIRPQGAESVSVTARNYDAREYAYDDVTPPA